MWIAKAVDRARTRLVGQRMSALDNSYVLIVPFSSPLPLPLPLQHILILRSAGSHTTMYSRSLPLPPRFGRISKGHAHHIHMDGHVGCRITLRSGKMETNFRLMVLYLYTRIKRPKEDVDIFQLHTSYLLPSPRLLSCFRRGYLKLI